ncbi:hypothetical protein [Bathycoccus sp. RCC716 virus 1]|uniref:EF-hand domain-containing protein n=1 Tax=Bathycoccus sp. RCC716 virus 1 TaxID=2530038 RepID=A0A7S6NY55_9PHYC|nr:hypothetical protein [Bathycoccus sp. RCC716 virus 1]
MTYRTEKVTVLRDWKLALLNYALQLLVVIWVIYSLFNEKTYIEREVPTGVVSSWGLGGNEYNDKQLAIYNNNPSFCDNLVNYAFNYSADWYYKIPICAYYTGAELISKLPTGNVMFFTTHIAETLRQRYTKPETGCLMEPNGIKECKLIMDQCIHTMEANFLAVGIEDSIFAFNHYFDSSIDSGPKPITYIRKEGSNENLYTFEEGESVRLKISEWLDIAGVELDKRLDEQSPEFANDIAGFNGAGDDIDKYPYLRTSGVRLNIKVKYHNYNLHKDNIKIGSKDTYAIINVEPKIGWFSKGDEIYYKQLPNVTMFDINNPVNLTTGQPNGIYVDFYRYGILIDIQQSGIVGEVNYVFVLLQLTSGLVLLGVASSIVGFVAKFLMGDISPVYKSIIQEEFDPVNEAAQYAAQACVASKVFKEADDDGKGDLDFEELRNLVKNCFAKTYTSEHEDNNSTGSDNTETFTHDDVTAMTYYLMRAADPKLKERILYKTEKTLDELKESVITLHEWQELCVAGVLERKKMQKIINLNPFVQDIKQTIDKQRKDEKVKIQERVKKLFYKN